MKTLKDFEMEDGKSCGIDLKGNIVRARIVYPMDLRQSAIEDIKEQQNSIKLLGVGLNVDLSELSNTIGITDEQRKNGLWICICMAKGRIDYIKEKFNITEEDLKQ